MSRADALELILQESVVASEIGVAFRREVFEHHSFDKIYDAVLIVLDVESCVVTEDVGDYVVFICRDVLEDSST